MVKRILIDAAHQEEIRAVIADDNRLEEFEFETAAKKQIKGNIYLAKVTRVEPSLQAAFVEYGGNRQGFLPFSEIHYEYFQLPIEDKERLKAAVVAEERAAKEAEQAEFAADEVAVSNAEAAAPFVPPVDAEPVHIPGGSDGGDQVEPMGESGDVVAEAAPVEAAVNVEAIESSQEVEVMEEEERRPFRRSDLYRKYKIQEVIKRNQLILVQVTKEERGNKGASLTTYISLAGRYCVLMPNSHRQGGVSRRIGNIDDRRRLRDVLAHLELSEGMSVIIRTAGTGRTKSEIKRDYDYLVKLWSEIRQLTISSQAPAMVYEEGDIIKRFVRDMYDVSIEEIVIEGQQAFESARNYMKMLLPSNAVKVKQHQSSQPIFAEYRIESAIEALYDNKVMLRSGGYIILNPTEALVSIDVNSGKATRERNVEETAVKTNLEAAHEIARQLRLRDLAGLIVIDFIDMVDYRNRRQVERTLKEVLATDRAKIQVGRISAFGLLEMSRQRMHSSFLESSAQTCPHCNGTGMVRSPASMAVALMRGIEMEASKGKASELKVSASPIAASYALNHKRRDLMDMETRTGTRIVIEVDPALSGEDFSIMRTKRRDDEHQREDRNKNARAVSMESVAEEFSENYVQEETEEEALPEQGANGQGQEFGRRRRRRGGRRRRGRDREHFGSEPQGESTPRAPQAVPAAIEAQAPASAPSEDRSDRSRMRYRDGASAPEQIASQPQNPPQPRPERREPPVMVAAEKAPSPEEMAAMAAQREENASLIKGLWKKITQ